MARQKNQDRISVERAHGVSKRQANRKIKDGSASQDFLNDKERKERATADLREHQAEKAKHDLEVSQGKYRLVTEVEEDGVRLGAIISGVTDAWLNDWPSRFAGLDEVQVRERLINEIDLFVRKVKAEITKVIQPG